MPMLEEARLEAGLTYGDLDLIMVTVGPGTFTGVRVGLAAARGLGLASGCLLQGVGTLEVLARAATESGPLLASIDARRGELYWQPFGADGSPVGPPRLDRIETVAAMAGHRGYLVGSGSERLVEYLPEWSRSAAPELPDAATMAQDPGRFGQAQAGTPPAPLYLREPDAKLPSSER